MTELLQVIKSVRSSNKGVIKYLDTISGCQNQKERKKKMSLAFIKHIATSLGSLLKQYFSRFPESLNLMSTKLIDS